MRRYAAALHHRARLLAATIALTGVIASIAPAGADEGPIRQLPPAPPTPAPLDPPPEPDPEPDAPDPPARDDGPRFEIDHFAVIYLRPDPRLPPVDELRNRRFQLGLDEQGDYVAPAMADRVVTVTLAGLSDDLLRRFGASALQTISTGIVEHLNARGFSGVLALPAPEQISPDGQDLREPNQRHLAFVIHTATVGQLRTLARGPRFGDDVDPENHPAHRRILAHAPLTPGPPHGDLLRTDELDEYLYALNRHPGRRVELAVAPGHEPGEVALDFLVSERRPWLVYFQTSNTGSESIGQWRQRFGFIHHQLTNRDDVLALDYLTAGFEDTHAVTGSYEAPLPDAHRWRYRLGAAYSEFTARDVGLLGEDFRGRQWSARADLIWNLHQHQQLFLDLLVGAQYRHIEVENQLFQQHGKTPFFLPTVALELERRTDVAETFGSLQWSHNLPGVAGTDLNEMRQLGRMGLRERDRDFMLLTGELSHAFFLEPVLNRAAFDDPSTPGSSTLAHQIALSVRGQYSFRNRLAPQFQQTLGGLHTVRGYPEAILPGDSSLVATAEYRLHLPRLLRPGPRDQSLLLGRPFRFRPETVYGRPDWNLMLRGFVDVGRVWTYEQAAFAPDEHTLFGTGVGVEFTYKHNLALRADYGVALREARDTEVSDRRLHIVVSVVY